MEPELVFFVLETPLVQKVREEQAEQVGDNPLQQSKPIHGKHPSSILGDPPKP